MIVVQLIFESDQRPIPSARRRTQRDIQPLGTFFESQPVPVSPLDNLTILL